MRSRIGLAWQLRRLGKTGGVGVAHGNVGSANRTLRLVGGVHDSMVVIDKPVRGVDEVCWKDRGWPYDNPLPVGLARLPVRPDKTILPIERAELSEARPIESDGLGQRLDVYA